MDSSIGISVFSIVLLIMLSAFFSSSETALVSCNRIRLRTMADEKDRRMVYLNRVLDNQSKMLAAILIGNNIVNLTASSLATSLAIRIGGSFSVGIATGILTLLILIFSEVAPKTAATVRAERLALLVAPVIYVLMLILTPVIFVINKIALLFLRLFRINPDEKPAAITEEELHTIVDVSYEAGVIEKDEMKMINNVVDFDDSVAKDLMVPKIDMLFVRVDATFEELLAVCRGRMFTRLPVYRDTTDEVIGMLNIKDLLFYDRSREFHVQDYLRTAFFTYEYKKTSELFMEMRQKSESIAIVLDEYGSTVGMVTMEDLLEEIVGEIRDEYDSDELKNVQKISEREYFVKGFVKLDDLNDLLEIHLKSEEFDSIGGYVIGLLGKLPKAGESVSRDGFTFRVESVEKNRVRAVRMWIPAEQKSSGTKERSG